MKKLFSLKLFALGFVIFLVLRVLPLVNLVKVSLRIPGLDWGQKLHILYEYLIDSFWDTPFADQLLTLALAFLTSLNILLFIRLIKRQRKILKGKTMFASISGMIMGLFGVGCLSCGVLILAPVLSLLGLSAYSGFFFEYGRFISVVGIVIVLISSLLIHRQLKKPLVC